MHLNTSQIIFALVIALNTVDYPSALISFARASFQFAAPASLFR